MTVLTEGDLRIDFADALSARKLDDENHGLSHCMKAVDFVVELSDRYLFIEVKDPQNPDSPADNRQRFADEFSRGALDEDFKYKYRDSFLYEWAMGRADKPIHYLTLVAHDGLQIAHLTRRQEELKRILPLQGPGNQDWQRPFVSGVGVFNVDSWNRRYPHRPVERISADAAAR